VSDLVRLSVGGNPVSMMSDSGRNAVIIAPAVNPIVAPCDKLAPRWPAAKVE